MAHLEQQVQAEMDELIHLRGRLDTVLRPFVAIQLKLKEPCFCPRLSGAAFFARREFDPYMMQIQEVTDPSVHF
ncbi:MAG: hypothetical protein ACRENP_29865 [Longimicrobiales bacterium]